MFSSLKNCSKCSKDGTLPNFNSRSNRWIEALASKMDSSMYPVPKCNFCSNFGGLIQAQIRLEAPEKENERNWKILLSPHVSDRSAVLFILLHVSSMRCLACMLPENFGH